jgi:hypothetical protein
MCNRWLVAASCQSLGEKEWNQRKAEVTRLWRIPRTDTAGTAVPDDNIVQTRRIYKRINKTMQQSKKKQTI